MLCERGVGLEDGVLHVAFGDEERVADAEHAAAREVGDAVRDAADGVQVVRDEQDADAIFREEVALAGIDKELGQYFAGLTNMRSVGVMGDFRTYDYAVALRAVLTSDFMTAESAQIPYEVLFKVTSRIINEVRGVNRVFYDLTSKPPGTIEME